MSGSARSGEPGHRHELWLGGNTLAKRENRKIRAELTFVWTRSCLLDLHQELDVGLCALHLLEQ
jgi:hypothetical protein